MGLITLFITAGMACPVFAQGDDLAGVVAEALSTNPDVAEARDRWLARREEVREAVGGFLPSVDLNAGIGYEYTDSPSTRAAGDHSTEELDRRELGLNIRQMLFDGWGTRSEVERQEARADSAAARLLAIGESTAMKTTEAYVGLRLYKELEDISIENLKIHKRIQDQIGLRSNAGVGSRADYDQVESRVALAEADLVAAKVNLLDARTTFRRVVGFPPAAAGYPPAEVAPGTLPESLERALEIAQENNPVLHTAAADIDAARAQHEAAKQFDYPRLDLELGGNVNDDIDGAEGHANDISAMLRIRYNLYRGGSDAARKRATAYNINEAVDVRNRSMRQLEETMRLAWAAYEATGAQLPLLERRVQAATSTRDAYAKQFNIGQRTLLDLLNSEQEVLRARQSLVEASNDHLLAQYRVLEGMGALVDHLGVAVALAAKP